MTNEITDNSKMKLESLDITAERLAALKDLFSEVFTEGKIDFDKLRFVLGDQIESGKERYGLTWAGKAEAMRAVQIPSSATLVPVPAESVEWDTTQNVFIEGENLEVLKLLQKSYQCKIKMIYIDPPYNTGNEFIYPDNYRDSIGNYLRLTGQASAEGVKFTTNPETSGRYHSNWLSMMYPRLFLARNLLREDGFIVASIDDAEQPNLAYLLKEIFGEENLIATLVWDRNRKNDAKFFSVGHEYMLVWAKNKAWLTEQHVVLRLPKEGIENIRDIFEISRLNHEDDWSKVAVDLREYFRSLEEGDPKKPLGRFTKVNEKGPFRDDGDISWPGGGGPTYDVEHPVTGRPCKVPKRGWIYPSKDRMNEKIRDGYVAFGQDETTVPSLKSFLFEKTDQVMRSVNFSYAQVASQEFDKIFDGIKVFDNPKHYGDLAKLVQYLTCPGDMVVDFFAGSCSLGHAILALNQNQRCPRSFICVQYPEPVNSREESGRNALGLGLNTISAIGASRLGRVIRQIANSSPTEPLFSELHPIDLGFRYYRLTTSNFKIWNADYELQSVVALEEQLRLQTDHILPGRNQQDILFEILLKAGYPLTASVHEIEIAGERVFSISDGNLLICLEWAISMETLRSIMALRPKPVQVICLDHAFQGNDQLKTNIVLEMESLDIQFHTV